MFTKENAEAIYVPDMVRHDLCTIIEEKLRKAGLYYRLAYRVKKADSIVEDTIVRPIERRLSPEEIRQKNKSGDHINIQTAPSIRTPNSIGPRRRNTSSPKR